MGAWDEIAARIAIISLPTAGRPYHRRHIEHAFVDCGMDCFTIVTLGEYDRNFRYQVTFSSAAMCDYFVRYYPTLAVETDKGVIQCPVESFLRREFRIKVSWFPDAGTDMELVNGLAMYGQVLAVAREKICGAFGQYFSGNRIVTIIPNGNIDDVPDFKDIRVQGNLYTCRFTVMGLKPRCHNCSLRCHVARDCNTCTRCGSAGHGTSDHPRHIPVTSFADRVHNARRPAPEFAPGDVDEEMEAQSSEGAHAPQHSPPPQHDTTRQQQPRQHARNVGASAQDPPVDEDGFREPSKSKRTKSPRNCRSRQVAPSEAVFTGDED